MEELQVSGYVVPFSGPESYWGGLEAIILSSAKRFPLAYESPFKISQRSSIFKWQEVSRTNQHSEFS